MVQIEIDREKCKSPRQCRKCLESCPEGLLMNYPRVARAPGKRAEDWAIVPLLLSLCTACKLCEQVCPEGAIRVSYSAPA